MADKKDIRLVCLPCDSQMMEDYNNIDSLRREVSEYQKQIDIFYNLIKSIESYFSSRRLMYVRYKNDINSIYYEGKQSLQEYKDKALANFNNNLDRLTIFKENITNVANRYFKKPLSKKLYCILYDVLWDRFYYLQLRIEDRERRIKAVEEQEKLWMMLKSFMKDD